jgi:hypothetical protein
VSFAYERRHQPLAPIAVFRRRVVHHVLLALLAVALSVALGVLGYHALGREGWLDALLDACMLLGGMGQVGVITTPEGKLFASFYALYAGLFFIAVSGLLLAPFLHRIVHRFHLDK